jgi:hypothetical protein
MNRVQLMTACVFLLLVGCVSQKEVISKDTKYQVYLESAEKLLENKRYGEALFLVEGVLMEDRNNESATMLYADIHIEMYKVSYYRSDYWGWRNKNDNVLGNIYSKLKIIIPKVRFEDISLEDAVQFLKVKSTELDPEKEGLSMIFALDEAAPESVEALQPDAFGDFFDEELEEVTDLGLGKVVNLEADDMPVGEVIKYICDQLGLNYRVEEYAVIIGDKINISPFETKFYSVSKEFLEASKFNGKTDFERAFKKVGLTFPPGAKVKYVESAQRIVMTNIAENQLKLAYYLKVFH